MLLPRFLTAVIGVPLVVLSIWWGQLPFFILFFGISLLALYEFFSLAEEAGWPVMKKLGLTLGAALSLSIFLFGTKMGFARALRPEVFFTPAVISAVLIFLLVVPLFLSDRENSFIRIGLTLLGIFYVVWGLSHLFLIRDLRPEGKACAFFLFLVIWALDVGAYAGGTKFGKNKLLEHVSPKKTWEGVLTGTIAAVLTAVICKAAFIPSFSNARAVCLGLFIAVLAQVSDLSESLFKRNVGVKDSGNLLPGHGGLLDRFDSFLLTAPAYYYLLVFLAKP